MTEGLPSLMIVTLDFETTGLNPEGGDRIILLAYGILSAECEVRNFVQHYIDPEVRISENAIAVHGISNADVAGKPRFSDIAINLRKTLESSSKVLVSNKSFVSQFLSSEFERIGQANPLSRCRVVDVIQVARGKVPGFAWGGITPLLAALQITNASHDHDPLFRQNLQKVAFCYKALRANGWID